VSWVTLLDAATRQRPVKTEEYFCIYAEF
jgi:hypothetical protein